jgi:serine/threonine protein kinase
MYKKTTYTERADIWSLGVTMYTLPTGRSLFNYMGRERIGVIHDRLPRLMEREELGKLSTAGREVLGLILQDNLASLTGQRKRVLGQHLGNEFGVELLNVDGNIKERQRRGSRT